MAHTQLFYILDTVDSTNNYATRTIHEGLAKNGMCWFANEQLEGKGQRGKNWHSLRGMNILMSIAVKQNGAFTSFPFGFSAAVALSISHYLKIICEKDFKIKWPNDIYFNDNKAGGILIENVFRGSEWEWSVVGIGINVNQTIFDDSVPNPISLASIFWKEWDVYELAKQIRRKLMEDLEKLTSADIDNLMQAYNDMLYKKGETVKLKKDNAQFETKIIGVNKSGELMCEDAMERFFTHGEVSWVMAPVVQ